jgi:hypothetical protein
VFNRLKAVVAYFLAAFPRVLTRTEIVKLVYLFEYYYHELYGKPFFGIQFIRYHYGPYCKDVVTVLGQLEEEGLISIIQEPHFYGEGVTFWHKWQGTNPPQLDPSLQRIALFVVHQTCRLELESIKKLVYETPPMRKLLRMEEERGCKLDGEVIDMREREEAGRKIPISRLKAAFKSINREHRGTDEEYRKTILQEFESLRVFRERAERCEI